MSSTKSEAILENLMNLVEDRYRLLCSYEGIKHHEQSDQLILQARVQYLESLIEAMIDQVPGVETYIDDRTDIVAKDLAKLNVMMAQA